MTTKKKTPTPARRPGRERAGILEPRTLADGSTVFYGRLRLGDGSKSPTFRIDATTEAAARAVVARHQAKEDATGVVLRARQEKQRAALATQGETFAVWFGRYLPTIEGGENYRGRVKAQAGKWILPMLGALPIATLSRDAVEDVRDHLDRAIVDGKLAPKTAQSIWSILSGALKSACASRDRSLRVHATPLHFGILPPKRGDSKQRPWLYPSEFARLVACENIPIEWRRTYAIAAYTGLRPNELRALTWGDVDLEAGCMNVSKAFDTVAADTKKTKSAAGQRVVPFPAPLRAVLESMKGRAGEPVVTVLGGAIAKTRGQHFRKHLAEAGITRTRLFAVNETEEPVDYRSLRDSYATWLAIAAVPEKTIQRRLGHASAQTTDGYIKAAETVDAERVGVPFGELPAALSAPLQDASNTVLQSAPNNRPRLAKPSRIGVPSGGFGASSSSKTPRKRDMLGAGLDSSPTSGAIFLSSPTDGEGR